MKSIITAYNNYWKQSQEIKERQRLEREAELEPLLKELGQELLDSELNITEIARLLERKDRTFLYRAQGSVTQGKLKVVEPEEPVAPYIIDYFDFPNSDRLEGAEVRTLDDGLIWVINLTEEGDLILPPAWEENPQPIYANIVKEVKQYVRNELR